MPADLSRLTSGVSIRSVIVKLEEALAKRHVVRAVASKMKASAVLLPVFMKAGQYHLLFMQRTERVTDHKGQICFPGGAYEKSDGALLNTALREAEEEIGLSRTHVRILGELDEMPTAATNYAISPFVALIPYPYPFKLDRWETEELLEIPINTLMEKGCATEGVTIIDNNEVVTYFYKYGDKVIWGATARILKQFLAIIKDI